MLETFLSADVLAITQLFIGFFCLIMVPIEILELLKKEAITTLNQVFRLLSCSSSMLLMRVLLLKQETLNMIV